MKEHEFDKSTFIGGLYIPDEVCEDLGWYEGTELEFEVDDVSNSFTLKKVEE